MPDNEAKIINGENVDKKEVFDVLFTSLIQ
jgi:hypothetical protein